MISVVSVHGESIWTVQETNQANTLQNKTVPTISNNNVFQLFLTSSRQLGCRGHRGWAPWRCFFLHPVRLHASEASHVTSMHPTAHLLPLLGGSTAMLPLRVDQHMSNRLNESTGPTSTRRTERASEVQSVARDSWAWRRMR